MGSANYFFEYFVRLFVFLNPILFFFCTMVWVRLYFRTRLELDRSYFRCYALEKQIDFLISDAHPDREFFDYMKKTYKDLER